MEPQETSLERQRANSIEGVGANESILAEVHKHPFGIILLYIQAGLALALALGLFYFLLPSFVSEENSARVNGILLIVTVVAISITLLILFVASLIYRQSYLIITDKNVTQVLQIGLFKRQVSELSMANVEDVTAEQRGIFATIFNFGKLVIETAGEQNNFIFTYCPRPNYYGKLVLDTRQRYIEGDPVRAVRANDRLNVPPPPPPPKKRW
jgi:hypothetical protein